MMISSLPPGVENIEQQKLDRMDPMQNQQCRVCEEPAAGFHFGAFTCEGCKSFFGRTCNNQSVIQECKNNYRCVVDKKNRTACKACRLRKCLMVGMSKSGSRYGRRSNWFKIHCIMQNQPNSKIPHNPPPHKSWPAKSEGSASENRDSSFGSSSRSPSPTNTSYDSLHKTSPTSPMKAEPPFPQHKHSQHAAELDQPQHFTPSSPLSSLYSSPLSNPLLSHFSPFYKMSPLLAHNPLLAHPLLLQLQAGARSPLDILQEQRNILDKFRMQQHLQHLTSPFTFARKEQDVEVEKMNEQDEEDDMMKQEREEDDERAVSPPCTEAPIDLSVRILPAPLLLPTSHPFLPVLPSASTPDSNQNLFPPTSSALDLTVSS